MRIAFVVDIFPSMSESFVLAQITGLLDRGHDVVVYALRDPGDGRVHDDVSRYGLDRRVRYVRQPAVPKGRRRVQMAGWIAAGLCRRPKTVARGLWYDLRQKRGFDYLPLCYLLDCLGERFAVVQAHFGPAGNNSILLRRTGVTRRLVTAFHGYDVTSTVRQYGANVYDDLFAAGDLFTYNSRSTYEKLLALGCPPDKMTWLPMGVPLHRIDFRVRQPDPDGRVLVLSVGRLVEMKGREYAIRAMARVIRRHPHVRYVIVGDGPLRSALEGLIVEEDMVGRIELLGWVDDATLAGLYGQAHLFLHPSVVAADGNTEGQGVVLLEAQAHGLPIVATRHGAFPETVLDGQSGFLVPERDVSALVDRLEYLIDRPDQWPAMGAAGRAHVAAHYDQNKLNRQQEQWYEHVLTGRAITPLELPSGSSPSDRWPYTQGNNGQEQHHEPNS